MKDTTFFKKDEEGKIVVNKAQIAMAAGMLTSLTFLAAYINLPKEVAANRIEISEMRKKNIEIEVLLGRIDERLKAISERFGVRTIKE